MGYLHAPLPALDVLMMDVQPGSLGVKAGKLIGDRESEILRAKILREELSSSFPNKSNHSLEEFHGIFCAIYRPRTARAARRPG